MQIPTGIGRKGLYKTRMSTVTITDEALVANNTSIDYGTIVMADAQVVHTFLRTAILLALGIFGPIAGMYAGTLIESPELTTIRWISAFGLGIGGIVLSLVLGVVWKRSWAVIIEVKEHGYRSFLAKTESDAQQLAADIRNKIK